VNDFFFLNHTLINLLTKIVGPIVSAAMAEQPSLGWRWTEYLTGILQAFILLLAVIFIDESYPPKLLVYKARRLRHESGNWALHAKFEEWDVSIKELCKKFLLRPVQLLLTPICFLVALYASFCYGILYMQLGAIPIIFGQIRGWNLLVSTLPFSCIFLGAIFGCGANVYNQLLYNKAYHAAGNRAVPEKRLPPMMIGSILFSGGQFMIGWTGGRRDIHWIVPCIGLVLLGTGFFTIFQAALNYLVDTFQAYAASAIAANTFLRSCFAAAFPLVVGPLFHNIGVGPGSSITGGFAALLIPVPFFFYKYGKRIRAGSKWSKASVYD
jgi:DHA1 family multidrug resistance protein-like MFS transporter